MPTDRPGRLDHGWLQQLAACTERTIVFDIVETERQGGLLEYLLDLRKGQRGIDLKHVGDDGCHAGRRRRSAEERLKHRRVDVVDAGEGNRAEKLRRVGHLAAVIVEPELVPAPDDENDSLASEPPFPGVLAESTAPKVMAYGGM